MGAKIKKINSPTIFIILGVTGDLAQRKIIPALFNLYKENMLPEKFRMVGFSRRDWDKNQFNTYLNKVVAKRCGRVPKKIMDKFLAHSQFEKGFFEDQQCYHYLDETLKKVAIEIGVCTNKLFHLAVPPSMNEMIFKNLAKSKLTKPCGGTFGWTRVIVEKPFGHNLKTAEMLDRLLRKLYKEEQIFRIDHYLGKETLQNILAFRFANTLFEPVWNKEYVERIEIKLHEKALVAERGAFYDETGALRDIGQNHMMQTLALITMEDPGTLETGVIRKARAEVLKALEPIKRKNLAQQVRRGQYQGFLENPEIQKNSKTETYFTLQAHINNKRWKGVPIILEAGKGLKKDSKKISIYFKERSTCVCDIATNQHLQNVLEFNISPKEGISLQFWTKKSGFTMEVERREFSFNYRKSSTKNHPHDAYEQLLFDAMRGDQTLFASTDEVVAAWKFITPILEHWHAVPLQKYEQGSAQIGAKTFN
ncbi:glucose-6-phosphate dehydrogenase [bacterium CG10_46_32]|nr:MAG: glucose-6-phosphate dehydrogenase [bacterium CG10_46_32]PIR55984.1 MAG: glucose-6-phosphate dehydrogenase [Parcubacteria group bacterium CG10_big_fil_rev_8_21_14_0_10_46_32]